MSLQIFRVGVTPQQRVCLLSLLDPKAKFLHGWDESAQYPRFLSSFHLPVIEIVAVKNNGEISSAYANNKDQKEFFLTLENVNFLFEVILKRLALSPQDHFVLAPLVDALNALRAGGTPMSFAPFDLEADARAWVPTMPI